LTLGTHRPKVQLYMKVKRERDALMMKSHGDSTTSDQKRPSYPVEPTNDPTAPNSPWGTSICWWHFHLLQCPPFILLPTSSYAYLIFCPFALCFIEYFFDFSTPLSHFSSSSSHHTHSFPPRRLHRVWPCANRRARSRR
jgi:hypothetical protein